MSRAHVYTVNSDGPDLWFVRKLSKELYFEEGFYRVSRTRRGEWLCECPAGHMSTCRHREMVFIFNKSRKVNKDALYDYDKKQWVK